MSTPYSTSWVWRPLVMLLITEFNRVICLLHCIVQLLTHVQLFVTHELQPTRIPWPSLSPTACSNSCPLSQWCHPTISSSVVPFSSCPQSFPALRSFLMSQFFISGGQSVGASASVLPMNIQDWFHLDWLVCSPCSPRDCQQSSPTPQFESINSLALSFLYISQLSILTSKRDYWKNHSFD